MGYHNQNYYNEIFCYDLEEKKWNKPKVFGNLPERKNKKKIILKLI